MTTVYRDAWTYEVGNEKSTNKLLAIKQSQSSAQPVRFNAPAAYDRYDFSKEPSQNLHDLLRLEAEKIRDTYKKVRIYFSGGADSLLMLKTFIENKISYDEIICLKCGIKDADYEIDKFAIPQLKSLNVPSRKIKISEPSLSFYRDYYNRSLTEDRIKTGSYTYTTHFRLIAQAELFNEQNFDPDIANLQGFDKPKIIFVDGEWYTYFLDISIEPFPHTIKFFSDNPELQAKQAHLLYAVKDNWRIKKQTDIWNDQDLWNESIGRKFNTETPKKILFFNEHDNFIKSSDVKIFYQNLKEKKAIEWAVTNQEPAMHGWLQRLQELSEYIPHGWWNNGNPQFGTIGIFSKFYGITTKSIKTVDQLFPNGFQND